MQEHCLKKVVYSYRIYKSSKIHTHTEGAKPKTKHSGAIFRKLWMYHGQWTKQVNKIMHIFTKTATKSYYKPLPVAVIALYYMLTFEDNHHHHLFPSDYLHWSHHVHYTEKKTSLSESLCICNTHTNPNMITRWPHFYSQECQFMIKIAMSITCLYQFYRGMYLEGGQE